MGRAKLMQWEYQRQLHPAERAAMCEDFWIVFFLKDI